MAKWFDAVQAQIYFSQRLLHEAKFPESSAAQRKMALNSTVLSLKHLWVCWLNEWSELLSPKQKLETLHTYDEFASRHVSTPDVAKVSSELARQDSWVRGFTSLETLTAKDWLPQFDEATNDSEAEQFEPAGLSLKSIDVRPKSVLNGLDDIEEMLTGIKQLINEVRAHHSEW